MIINIKIKGKYDCITSCSSFANTGGLDYFSIVVSIYLSRRYERAGLKTKGQKEIDGYMNESINLFKKKCVYVSSHLNECSTFVEQ